MLINPNNNDNAYCFCQILTHFRWRWDRGDESGIVAACSRDHARVVINRVLDARNFTERIDEAEFGLIAWSWNERMRALPVENQAVLVMR